MQSSAWDLISEPHFLALVTRSYIPYFLNKKLMGEKIVETF